MHKFTVTNKYNGSKPSTNQDILCWTSDDNATKINLAPNADTEQDIGIGGKKISDSINAGTVKRIDFDNIIWCQSLPTTGKITFLEKQDQDTWIAGDQLVGKKLKDNIAISGVATNNVNFVYILLSLGLVKSNGKIIEDLYCSCKNNDTSPKKISTETLAF